MYLNKGTAIRGKLAYLAEIALILVSSLDVARRAERT
jgi:hypothetical protein